LLDVNLLKPSRIDFVLESALLLAASDTQESVPKWLEYIYRTVHQYTLVAYQAG
jgi:hypothetical protein